LLGCSSRHSLKLVFPPERDRACFPSQAPYLVGCRKLIYPQANMNNSKITNKSVLSHSNTHTYIHTHIHTPVLACTHTPVLTCKHTHSHTHSHTHTPVNTGHPSCAPCPSARPHNPPSPQPGERANRRGWALRKTHTRWQHCGCFHRAGGRHPACHDCRCVMQGLSCGVHVCLSFYA
jgi:hypothetical protein